MTARAGEKGRRGGSRREGRKRRRKGADRPESNREEESSAGEAPVTDSRPPFLSGALDFPGLFLLFMGMMALLWVVNPLGVAGTAHKETIRWIMLVVAAASLGAFILRLIRRVPDDMAGEDPTRVSMEFMSDEELEEIRKDWTLAEKFIDLFTFSGTLRPYLPYFGIAVIVADLAFNLYSGRVEILTFDTVVILFGITLIAYNFIPYRFFRERDFALLFMGFMCLFLVYLMYFIVGPIDRSREVTEEGLRENPNPLIQYLLAEPTAMILRGLGVDVSVHGEMIEYENRFDDGESGAVLITSACSGIWSVAIFLSMYLSYLMSEYSRFTRRMGVLVLMGIFMAYVANILRMSIIVMAGVYYGPDALYWTHKEMGWIIFMAWVFLFWWMSNRLLKRRD